MKKVTLLLFFFHLTNANTPQTNAMEIDPTKIHEYVKNEDEKKVSLFLYKGGSSNSRDKEGYPLLYWAIQRDNIPIAKLLLKYGANVNARVNVTSSWVAVLGNDLREESTIITCSLLFALPSFKSLKMADLLLKSRANVNAVCRTGNTNLHNAVFTGEISMIELLLKYNADVNARNGYGLFMLLFNSNMKKSSDSLFKRGLM